MYYYDVWVRSNHYHGRQALTYSYNQKLQLGQIVEVQLKNEQVEGVITAITARPNIRIKSISAISVLPPLPTDTLKLMHWMLDYYPAPLGVITQLFIPGNLFKNNLQETAKQKQNVRPNSFLTKLTKEQKETIDKIKTKDTYIIHGRTGSGKTRIYLELAKEAITSGKSVIVLTPEISLTTQLASQFNQIFSDQVIIIHSTLTSKQRLERWKNILLDQEPKVIIGPRSAIFSPVANVGLIIMDESHEPAYKQEQAPYYHTTRVASKLRDMHQAILILGSATPLVNDYYMATKLNKPILRLTSLAQQIPNLKSNVIVVDCRDRSNFNRSSYLSQSLIEAIEETLANKNQSLLYLNRRGTARVIICEVCDWQAKCPHCDLPFTYHGDNHTLRCHICGFVNKGLIACPKCNNPSIKYLSIGTKAVVDEVARLFPNAKIMRFDADNLKSERLELHYEQLRKGNTDIIIGTQLLAKGLDLPKLALVGVVLADTSLQIPDYTVNERTYELLNQVIGRIGRGHVAGQAFIQTYQPDNKIINAAIKDNWQDFYANEISERKNYNFPPFTHLLKLSVLRSSPKAAETATKKLMATLPSNIKIEGPAPAFHEKQDNKFKWQLIIKSANRNSLIKIINQLPSSWSYNIDPSDLM